MTYEWEGYEYMLRWVIWATERSIDKHGQVILIPEIELVGWWTSLDNPKSDIIKLYADHGAFEQYYSEFRTDLDVEQLARELATNALILATSVLVYNLPCWIGQDGLVKAGLSRRQGVKRRRIKTVMQVLMYVAVRVCQGAHRIQLFFGKGYKTFEIMAGLYQRLAYG